jgi:hypothetical protein
MQALAAGKAIVVVSTSAEETCRVNTTFVAITGNRGVGRDAVVNLNNGYELSDFEDRFGTFDAFVLDPDLYAVSLGVLGSLQFEKAMIGRFRLQPGELKYIGDVHGAGCNGLFGGDVGVWQGDEWESVRPRLTRRFPGLDASRVVVEPFSAEPGVGQVPARAPAAGPLAPPAATGTVPATGTMPATGAVPQIETRPAELLPGEPLPRRPVWNVGLVIGFAGGGDDLVTATAINGSQETLAAGTGLTLALSVARGLSGNSRHALLLGVEGGVKGWNIGGEGANYDLELVRFPIVPHLRYVFGNSPGVRLVLSAGPQYEMRVRLSGSGAAAGIDSRFDNALGGMAEVGAQLDGDRGGGVTVSLRYTQLRYRRPDSPDSVDASSVGLFMSLAFTKFRFVAAR